MVIQKEHDQKQSVGAQGMQSEAKAGQARTCTLSMRKGVYQSSHRPVPFVLPSVRAFGPTTRAKVRLSIPVAMATVCV